MVLSRTRRVIAACRISHSRVLFLLSSLSALKGCPCRFASNEADAHSATCQRSSWLVVLLPPLILQWCCRDPPSPRSVIFAVTFATVNTAEIGSPSTSGCCCQLPTLFQIPLPRSAAGGRRDKNFLLMAAALLYLVPSTPCWWQRQPTSDFPLCRWLARGVLTHNSM